MKVFFASAFILSCYIIPIFAQEVTPPPASPSNESLAPTEGRDSRWRHLINLGVGSLSMQGKFQ